MKRILRALVVTAALLASLALFADDTLAASNVLSWTDNSTNETFFKIERKTEACAGALPFAEIATVTTNVVTFTDSLVAEGSTYCYRVRASNTAGDSGYSNTAGRLVPFTVPAAPSGLGATGGP